MTELVTKLRTLGARLIGRGGSSKARRESNLWIRQHAAPITGSVLSIGSGRDEDGEGGLYQDYFPRSHSYLPSRLLALHRVRPEASARARLRNRRSRRDRRVRTGIPLCLLGDCPPARKQLSIDALDGADVSLEAEAALHRRARAPR